MNDRLALAVAQVGFLSHSSFDGRVLDSKRVRRAVLCDPVLLPSVWTPGGFAPRENVDPCPTRVWKAELAYSGDSVGIPRMVSPVLRESTERTHPRVGRADLLDDTWAEFGPRVLPWMRGVRADAVAFEQWSRDAAHPFSPTSVRRAYRAALAADAAEFLVGEEPPGTLIVT